MISSNYTVRNYLPDDMDDYACLLVEAERAEPTGRCVSTQWIAGRLGLPDYFPAQDLFVVEGDGKIVAFIEVLPERAIGRVILDCWVHPEHRRRGLATRLLNCAARRAGELGAKVAHVNVAEDNVPAGSVLPRYGFECVRRYLEMKMDLGEVEGIDQVTPGCRPLERGEERKLALLQNRCYAGTWGYNPNTAEQVVYYTGSNFGSPEDVILMYEGEDAIGYCWMTIIFESGIPSKTTGRIFMLGVEPRYRGRGIGRKMLLAGLARLKGNGFRVARLTVDSENERACALYRSAGFEIDEASLWYEKPVG